MHSDPLVIAGRTFRSRLIVGTGKYPSHAVMADAHRAAGADMVTVAVRRVNLPDPSAPPGASRAESLIDYIDQSRIFLLPNTAGCYTAEEAIRTARLGREVGLSNWVKLEVIGDEQTLFPDNIALVEATRVLVAEGFVVLPYTNDDPVVCRKLEEAGAAAVMPLGAPIGSGLGIQNPNNIRIIKAQARVPVIVDAGVGTASDAAIAMELGADGVLMNSAIALAHDPVAMAGAMKLAVEAGRLAFVAGRIPRREFATPSSPTEGMVGTGTPGPASTQRLRPARGVGEKSAEGGSPTESAREWGPARIEK
jgi:thiazole synthase